MGREIKLPPKPDTRVLAFDESVEVHGYNEDDLLNYAEKAVRLDRANMAGALLVRVWEAIRGK